MKNICRSLIIGLSTLFLMLVPLSACSNDEPTQEVVPTGPKPDVTITIGHITDMTGPAAGALQLLNKALKDVVKRYNDENLIPGVKIKLIDYDTQFDPARTIPGYEFLKSKGADLILTDVASNAAVLKPRADADHMVVFTLTANLEDLSPPGWVFSMGTIPQYEAYTLLNWIAENHWDYQTKGPAKIGGAAWSEPYSESFMAAMREYANAHSDQFEWVNGYLTDFKFAWGTEVQGLKDCDYVFLPTPPITFVTAYRAAGYEGTFINSISNSAFMGTIDNADLWDEMDGSLFLYAGMWWNEHGEEIDMIRNALYQYRPNEAEEIIRAGSGYIGFGSLSKVHDIIGNAVKEVGPENFNSEVLYHAAETYVDYKEGLEIASFSEEKRYAVNYYCMYKIDAEQKDMSLIRNGDETWFRQLTEP